MDNIEENFRKACLRDLLDDICFDNLIFSHQIKKLKESNDVKLKRLGSKEEYFKKNLHYNEIKYKEKLLKKKISEKDL